MTRQADIISPDKAGTLPALFLERARRTPNALAYRSFTIEEKCCNAFSWGEVERLAANYQKALRKEGLVPGDRVAMMLKNCLEWVLLDLAAMGLGLVTVPLYVKDRPENFTFILKETGARLLIIEGVEQWHRIEEIDSRLLDLERIVTLKRVCEKDCDPRLAELPSWLEDTDEDYYVHPCEKSDLATIVYTSGTTGNPKGVMLSHANILEDAFAGLKQVTIYPDDLFLSFLPLSHTFERTVGYYLPMMAGACVAHVRSIDKLSEDLVTIRPTVLCSVPLIFERINKKILLKLAEKPAPLRYLFFLTAWVGWKKFLHHQGRAGWTPLLLFWPLLKWLVADRVMAGLGGRLRVVVSGGAPLAPPIAERFISFGVNLLQGYGLTETGPVVSVNVTDDNIPETVGRPLPGVEVKLASDGELLIRGPNVMLGYWQNSSATESAIDEGGWFHSGDQAKIDGEGHISITGRKKEIIVLSNGEKVPPEDLETAITMNPLFEQALVVGEGRPYLAALVVLNSPQWIQLAAQLGIQSGQSEIPNSAPVEKALIAKIASQLARFPGYARIRRVYAILSPWGVQDGLVTATLKLRRKELMDKLAGEIEALYTGIDS
jgi:long-chain acyl-CoA synthetase